MSVGITIYLALGALFVGLILTDANALRAGYLRHYTTRYVAFGVVVTVILGVILWPLAACIVVARVLRRVRQGQWRPD